MAMSEKSIEEYTEKMRGRYARMTGRKARGRLLDEFVEVTGWDRKHGNKVLLGMKRRRGGRGKRGAPRPYGQAVEEVLKTCCLAMDQPCGTRSGDPKQAQPYPTGLEHNPRGRHRETRGILR